MKSEVTLSIRGGIAYILMTNVGGFPEIKNDNNYPKEFGKIGEKVGREICVAFPLGEFKVMLKKWNNHIKCLDEFGERTVSYA